MKKILTILLIAISGLASAQTYQLNYPDIRIGSSPTGKIVLRGSNVQFPFLALGNTTDSVLTIAGGQIKKVPRSQFTPASPSGDYIQANPIGTQNAYIDVTGAGIFGDYVTATGLSLGDNTAVGNAFNISYNNNIVEQRWYSPADGANGGYALRFDRLNNKMTYGHQDYFPSGVFDTLGVSLSVLGSFETNYLKLNKTPLLDALPTQVLTRDATTGEIKYVPSSSFGGGGSAPDTTVYRTVSNSFTKAQTNTQISNAIAAYTPPSQVDNDLSASTTRAPSKTAVSNGLATKQSNLKIVNVQDYGAVGDGVTDVTTLIQNAINATGDGGQLYFPKGKYITTGGLTISNRIRIFGYGEALKVSTDPLPTTFTEGSVSIINTSNSTNLFTVNSDGVTFEGMTLQSTASAPTGSGILFNKANVMRMNNVGVLGFAINVNIVNGALWNILNCDFYNPTTYNLQVNFQTLPDGGDQSITNTNFYTGPRSGITHINYKGGGGLKINSSKFNQGGGTAALAKECIKLSNDVGLTVDLLISNSSFENYTDRAINLAPVYQFSNVVINGNQFSASATTSTDVILLNSSLLYNVSITNNIIDASVNGINNQASNNTIVSGNMFGSSITNRYVGQPFSQTLIPSKTSIGNLDATYNFNVYGDNAKTVNSASTVMAISSKDATANMGLFYRLKGGATASDRYSGISSYENGFGSLPLVLQDLGGNVGINNTNPQKALDVNGEVRVNGTTTGTAGTDSLLVTRNGVIKKISPGYYSTGGGGSQTLDQVLTAGNTSAQNATVGGLSASNRIAVGTALDVNYISKFTSGNADNFNAFSSTAGVGEYGIYQNSLYFQALSLSGGVQFYGNSGSNPGLQINSSNNTVINGSLNLPNLTATTTLGLDASKNVVSITNTGTGNAVRAASPTLTGTPLSTTAAAKTNTTQIATTAFSPKQFTATGSGTGSATSITVAHGVSGVTSANSVVVTANNAAAGGLIYATLDATNVTIFYSVAPASGTNNLAYSISIR